MRFLLDLARKLKPFKYAGNETPRFKGKDIALIFKKKSTRTRFAVDVAVRDKGGHVAYIDPARSQLGHKECLKHTARALGSLYDGVECRSFHQSVIEDIACFSHVPVWNGLTDEAYRAQILADLRTCGLADLRTC